eukprot:jgi/Undpi1/4627/HiC_scaffold_18.g07981.m1
MEVRSRQDAKSVCIKRRHEDMSAGEVLEEDCFVCYVKTVALIGLRGRGRGEKRRRGGRSLVEAALSKIGAGVALLVREVNNPRAGETNVKYAPYAEDYLALNPNRSLVTNQDEFDRLWPDITEATHFRWKYGGEAGPSVIRNVFRAYWSMATVWSLMNMYSVERGFQYDAVVLARPDVWFHVDTDLPSRKFPLPERTVYVPSFGTKIHAGKRKNDRFAYGSVTAMRVLMNRISTFIDADAAQMGPEIDSEMVLGFHLKANNIAARTMEFPITRVRLTGGVPEHDQKRVRKLCRSRNDPMACEMGRGGGRREDRGGGEGLLLPQCCSSAEADPSDGAWRECDGGLEESPKEKIDGQARPADRWSACGGKLNLIFIRNDLFDPRTVEYEGKYCETHDVNSSRSVTFALEPVLKDTDTLVVNSDAHKRTGGWDAYRDAMKASSVSLKRLQGDNAISVVRNTVPGHWRCEEKQEACR